MGTKTLIIDAEISLRYLTYCWALAGLYWMLPPESRCVAVGSVWTPPRWAPRCSSSRSHCSWSPGPACWSNSESLRTLSSCQPYIIFVRKYYSTCHTRTYEVLKQFPQICKSESEEMTLTQIPYIFSKCSSISLIMCVCIFAYLSHWWRHGGHVNVSKRWQCHGHSWNPIFLKWNT